jgi:hypothetical protein
MMFRPVIDDVPRFGRYRSRPRAQADTQVQELVALCDHPCVAVRVDGVKALHVLTYVSDSLSAPVEVRAEAIYRRVTCNSQQSLLEYSLSRSGAHPAPGQLWPAWAVRTAA